MRGPGGRDWQDAVDASALITGEPTPPAAIELLWQADEAVYAAITQPYAQCGHAFDGASGTTLTDRRFGAMVAPAGLAARAWLTGWATPGIGGMQAAIVIESTSSGWPPPAGADAITVPSAAQGTAAYADVAGVSLTPVHWMSGDDPATAPAATLNRRIELADSLSPTMEEFRIQNAAGFGLVVVARRADLE